MGDLGEAFSVFLREIKPLVMVVLGCNPSAGRREEGQATGDPD